MVGDDPKDKDRKNNFFFTIYLVRCMQYKHRDEKYADKCKVLLTCEAKGRTRKEIGM